MRGTKAAVVDEDYEVGGDAEEGRPAGSDKPLSSRYRGVCWNRKNRRWQAAINSGGKYVYLGSFLSEYDAARAFDKAAVKLRGTRAKLNFSYSEYVDENGNLLEDPKMKNVMYKIEAIQGGNCQGGGGGGHHGSGAAAAAAAAAAHKADPGSDEGALLPSGDAVPPPPIPLPLPPQLRGPEEGAGAGAGPGGALPPVQRQLSPLIHAAGGGPQVKQHCSSDGSKGPEWQGPRGAGLQQQQQQQHAVGLNLAVGSAAAAAQQQQHRPQAPSCLDPPLFPHFPETLPTGPAGALSGGGTGMPRSSDGAPALPGPPLSMPPGVPAVGSGRPHQGTARSRGGAPGLPQPPSPMQHNVYGGASCMSTAGATVYDVPPGGAALPYGYGGPAAGASSQPRVPGPAVQRAIAREMPQNTSITSYVPHRFQNHTEDMWGVLYQDAASPALFGSAVWTGKNLIRMGLYDTERDAVQAAIRCMQLYIVFYQEVPRAELFNALTTIVGCGAGAGGGAGEEPYDDAPAPPPPLPYGPRGSSRGSGGGAGLLLGEALVDAHAHAHSGHLMGNPHPHPHPPGAPYGTRNSSGGTGLPYNGPDCGLQQQHQHQQQQPGSSPGAGGGGDGPGAGGLGYGPSHDPHAGETAASGLQTGSAVKQPDLDNLFAYMNAIRQSRCNANPNGSNDNGLGGDCGPDPLHGGGGAAGVGGKRPLHDSYVPYHDVSHHQRHGGGDLKRARLEGAGGASEVELVLKPPSSEFRNAHNIQLPVILKQLQQVQASSGGV